MRKDLRRLRRLLIYKVIIWKTQLIIKSARVYVYGICEHYIENGLFQGNVKIRAPDLL